MPSFIQPNGKLIRPLHSTDFVEK